MKDAKTLTSAPHGIHAKCLTFFMLRPGCVSQGFTGQTTAMRGGQLHRDAFEGDQSPSSTDLT